MLNDALKKAALDVLALQSLTFLDVFARKNHELLNELYSRKIIDDQSIDDILTEQVVKQAKIAYASVIVRRKEPDHTDREEYMAYGIENGIYSEDEISRIGFRHGETAEEFVRLYGVNNLVEKLRKTLLAPPEPLKMTFEGDVDYEHPSCCSH